MKPGLGPYPDTIDSGVPWLAKVPAHWDVLPALAAFQPKQVRNTGMREKTVLSLSHGRIVIRPPEKLRGLVPESFETYQLVDPGDIVMRTTDLQNDQTSLRVGFSRHRGIITSAYLCLRTTPRVIPEYGYQCLNAYDLLKVIYGYGSGLRQNLDFDAIKRIPVVVPPPREQAAIVRFLDHADVRIRRYIGAKQNLRKLLEEQRQAIIDSAVTRGLNPETTLAMPRVKWAAETPAHWQVSKVKHLARPGDRTFVDGDWIESPYITDDGIRLIQTGNVGPGTYREKGFRYITEDTFRALNCTEFEPGDVLICRLGEPVGRACLAPDLGKRMITSVDVCILKVREDVLAPYVVYAMSSRPYLGWVGSLVRGSTRDRVSRSMLGSFGIPLPPVAEQAAIVSHLDDRVGVLDAAIKAADRQIDVVREFRSRVVANVVTGMLDVREAAARLATEDVAENFDESLGASHPDEAVGYDELAEVET